jgi:hypothetical protein
VLARHQRLPVLFDQCLWGQPKPSHGILAPPLSTRFGNLEHRGGRPQLMRREIGCWLFRTSNQRPALWGMSRHDLEAPAGLRIGSIASASDFGASPSSAPIFGCWSVAARGRSDRESRGVRWRWLHPVTLVTVKPDIGPMPASVVRSNNFGKPRVGFSGSPHR